jgi:catechol 2,3-dioxygenase-like lactoylglutathione lyase family enzyme
MTTTTGIGSLDTVVFDVPDPETSARFWETFLGGTRSSVEDDWITVVTPDRWGLGFQLAPDLVAPQWPSSERPQQLHLDVRVLDLAVSTEQAVSLGATLLQENASWNTLADPAGHPFDIVVNAEVSGPTLFGVMFDVPDAHAAAAFWSAVLGDPVTYDQDGMAMLGGERPVLFQQVESYVAPEWPDPAKPQQGHLDLEVADLDTAEAAALAAGARRLPGGGETFRVFADPAGHPFCLCG